MNHIEMFKKYPNGVKKVSQFFISPVMKIQQFILIENQLKMSNQINLTKSKTRLTDLSNKIFTEIFGIISSNAFKNVGKISNKIFMVPLDSYKVMKITLASNGVRTINIYDLTNNTCITLNQNQNTAFSVKSNYQLIHNIVDFTDNWKEYLKLVN